MAADISGYEFYNSTGGNDQLSVVFPEGTTIAAGGVLIVVGEAGAANYASTGVQIFQMTQGNFSNSGEALSLRDAFGNTVNAVTYDDGGLGHLQPRASLASTTSKAPTADVQHWSTSQKSLHCRSRLRLEMATMSPATGRLHGWTMEPQVRPTVLRLVATTRTHATSTPTPFWVTKASAHSIVQDALTPMQTTSRLVRRKTTDRACLQWRTIVHLT